MNALAKTRTFMAAVLSLGCIATSACAAEAIIRYPTGNDFPIAAAVEVPATANLVFFSGNVPPALDPQNQVKTYAQGSEAQTQGVLESIEQSLKRAGLGLGDIVKMQVYLVGDPALDGKMDFAGFMRAYTQFFGTAQQPNLPARSVFQVAGLADERWLVEIEVIAVRQKPR